MSREPRGEKFYFYPHDAQVVLDVGPVDRETILFDTRVYLLPSNAAVTSGDWNPMGGSRETARGPVPAQRLYFPGHPRMGNVGWVLHDSAVHVTDMQ
jgi:hypothetical protein